MSDRTHRTAVHEHVREELVRFVRALRHAGAAVPANAATTAVRALVEVGLEDPVRTRTALRASLLTDREDFETFDRLFEAFWDRLTADLEDGHSRSMTEDAVDDEGIPLGDLAADDGPTERTDGHDGAGRETGRSVTQSVGTGGPDTDDAGDGDEVTTALYSPSGTASPVDGHLISGGNGLEPAFRDLTRALAGLQGRRFGPGADYADVRRALRTSVSTGGTLLSVPRRERRRTAVRALLLVDVSRSVLDIVDRGFLIDFLRQARSEWRATRVFLFDEDLREVTASLDAPSAAAAMRSLEAAETEWGGGTRIGGSLASLHETAPEAVDHRTVVFLVSDGLEMGDVEILERELSWLSRRAKRVLWLNPLAGSANYEPTARGMAAALPYLDGLFALVGPDDVAELARQLRQQGPGGRIGYEFTPRETHRRTTSTITHET